MYYRNDWISLTNLLARAPEAVAYVAGNADHPQLHGSVKFYTTKSGVLVTAEVFGLPPESRPCETRIFAFHIHSGASCTGNAEDSFADVGMHYNPTNCPHPHHAGDMPPLFSANGKAFLAFFTDRFSVKEILGKTVVIHDSPDDFTTQPSGNAGKKIACGRIVNGR